MQRFCVCALQTLRFNPVQLQLQVVRQRAVHQRLLQRFVGIFILHVLANNADGDRVLRVVNPMHEVFPAGKIPVLRLHPQCFSTSVSTFSFANISGTS